MITSDRAAVRRQAMCLQQTIAWPPIIAGNVLVCVGTTAAAVRQGFFVIVVCGRQLLFAVRPLAPVMCLQKVIEQPLVVVSNVSVHGGTPAVAMRYGFACGCRL